MPLGANGETAPTAFGTLTRVSCMKYDEKPWRTTRGACRRSRFPTATMPLAEDAYERLRNMIITGELPPESAITENSIVERLEIGKTPVREAMRRLVLEGLLEVTPRMGYSVPAVTREDVENLFQLRGILETAAAELAVDRLDDAAIDRLSELSEIAYDADDRESLLAYVAANAEFHEIIAKGSGNRRLLELIRLLMTESRRYVHLAILSDEHSAVLKQQHINIVDAFRRRDRVKAGELMGHHVEDGRLVVQDGMAVGRLTN
jgi:DNA-binding GntR family transcriptional regulator